jgi:hypothetical protein
MEAWTFGLAVVAVHLAALNWSYPKVGPDYELFFPRYLDTLIYVLNNGLFSIQWWTPSFLGGFVSYPNPQFTQFILPQILTLWLSPWLAVNLIYALFLLLGYFCVYLLLRRSLFLPHPVALTGAAIYSTTAFYLHHIAAGHITFHVYHLLPVLLYVYYHGSWSGLTKTLLYAFVSAYFVYAGGYNLAIIFAMSFTITVLSLRVLLGRRILGWKWPTLPVGLGLGALLSLSKLHAVYLLTRFLPRKTGDIYTSSLKNALLGLFHQLFTTPLVTIAGDFQPHSDSNIADILKRAIGTIWGLHEIDIGVSPLILFILFIALCLGARTWFGPDRSRSQGRKAPWSIWALLGLCLWLSVELCIAKGPLYHIVKSLPFFKSLRVNLRNAAIFVLPLTVLSAHLTARLSFVVPPRLIRILPVLALAWFAAYIDIPAKTNYTFDVSHLERDWDDIVHRDRPFAISRIENDYEYQFYDKQASCLKTEETLILDNNIHFPLFVGESVWRVEAGQANMMHPAGYIFPRENGVEFLDRITIDDPNLPLFLENKETSWRISRSQAICDRISLALFLLLSAVIAGKTIHRLGGLKFFGHGRPTGPSWEDA